MKLLKFLLLISLLFPRGLYAEFITEYDLISGRVKAQNLNEKEYSVYYFLNSKCPCSQAHFDHLNTLVDKYKNFSFMGFHSNKKVSKKYAQDYFKKFKINFPVYLDQRLVYADRWKAVKTPHVFIVNKVGEIIYGGGATDSRDPKNAKNFYLQNALKRIAKGLKPISPKEKVLGCYIER